MRLGQAAYGELNKGHALLAASPSATISGSIVNQMDLRGSVPPGVQWQPYFSGFLFGDHYVLARTASDHTAVRPGMVRSKALFVSLDNLKKVHSIAGAFRFLEDHFDDPAPLEDVKIDIDNGLGTAHRGLATAMVKDFQSTIVWPFETGFEEAITNLWRNLWPEARQSFSFRLAFSPQDIPDRPTVVKTLAGLKSRWVGYPLVKEEGDSDDAAVATLMGLPEGNEIKALMTALNARLSSFSQLPQVAEISRALTIDEDFADLISATRLICFLSPSPTDGANEKIQLLERTSAAFQGADTGAIRMSRNLDLSAIADAEIFWRSLRNWAHERLPNEPSEDAATVLLDTDREGPSSQWKSSITAGLQDYFQSDRFDIRFVLGVVFYQPSTLRVFLKLAGARPKFDKRFASGLLASSSETPDYKLLALTATEGLNLSHAACCALLFEPGQAVMEHIKGFAATSDSIKIALTKSSDQEIISIAVREGIPALIEIAASKAAMRQSLLKSLDVNDGNWRKIWLQVLREDIKAYQAPRKPEVALRGLLDLLVAGTIDEAGRDLLEKLSKTALANIVDYKHRAQVWLAIPAEMRQAYLDATADAWISQFLIDGLAPLEQPLKERVLAPTRVEKALQNFSTNIALGCAYFRMFGELPESEFRKWLWYSIKNIHLATEDAAAIGRLVAARDWERTARDLADWCLEGRNDIIPAVDISRDQIGYLRRYRLDLMGSLAPGVKWRILEEIGVELYPIGPGDRSLWERAGGKNGDIPRATSGSEGWRIVVQEMEQGRRKIDPASLIKVMAEDFPGNHTLRKMRYDRFFH
ncbi:hypothetical protein PMI07_006333 [Rhizobium sp. CF080]|uniref:GAP1-N1 domain-containing protein n=1 Tax=Rhizobium sp. (strain CF080) TaxID=1144310 RepID=UPI0002718118|nr:effector-associated domain EAD1-containing protein [Rhizobium sp. CF080]EUC00053.1 hypothetical protein PMI07_006333 [Rhizobium sp. CF080]